MIKQWIDFFRKDIDEMVNPSFIDFGCGLGPYGKAATLFDCEYTGIEKSEYAINTNPYQLNLIKGDLKDSFLKCNTHDIALCLDVLEHLEYDDLDIVLNNISEVASYTIFSIPYVGDPNLEADKTHKIKESKEWWINKLSNYFTIQETPKDWLFSNQLLIGTQKND
jgi:hypothetical protein